MRGLHADLSHLTAHPLPIVIDQPRSSNTVLIGLLGLAMALLAVPLVAFAQGIAGDPAVRELVTKQPFATAQVFAGAFAILSLFGVPLLFLVGRALTRCTVMIGPSEVTGLEKGPFGSRAWTEPLGAYGGLNRRMRSSLSGVRDELVLTHRDPRRSLVLMESVRISEADVENWARFLALAEIRSRDGTMATLGAEPKGALGKGPASSDVRFAA